MKLSRRVRLRLIARKPYHKGNKGSVRRKRNRTTYMEDLKHMIAQYAIPQSKLEQQVSELEKQVAELKRLVDQLQTICQELRQGYDISECQGGHLVDY